MPLEPNSLQSQPGGQPPGQGTQGQETPPNQGGGQGAQGAGSTPEKAKRPDWAPEAYWDPNGATFKPEFGEHYNELATFRQAETDRLAKLPKTPAEYDLSLPEDLQLPDGVKREDFVLDANAPEAKAFREIVHGEKVSPDAAKKMLGLLAKRDAEQVTRVNKRVAEEQAQLGAQFGERVAAVGQFLEGRVGKQSADALMSGLFTAAQVKAMEALATQFSAQGATKIPGKGAEPHQDPNKIEGWDKMTFEEKRAHQNARRAG